MNRSLVLAVTLLVVASAAGCLRESGDDDEDARQEEAVAPFLDVVSVVEARGGQGEPSLGVAPDGTLFVNNPDPGGSRSGAAYRSTDGGANWTHVGTPTDPYPNFDPDLAVDLDGNVWFDVLYLGCVAVSVSRDAGESWSEPNPAACFGPGGDRQYVVPTRGGTAYLYYHQLPTFQQTAVKTTDYGETWVPTGPVEFPDHHLLVDEGSGWGGGGFWNPQKESVYFTFSWFRDGAAGDGGWAPAYAVTRDGGGSWSVGFGPEPVGRPLGLSLVVGAADEAGNVYLAWAEQHGEGDDEESHVYIAASTDDGVTWSDAIRVDRTPESKVFPAITAGAAGEVAVAYYTSDARGHPQAVGPDAKWNVTLAWTHDALAPAPVFSAREFSNGTVKQGGICPSGTGCSGDREFLDYFQIKRLPDGRIGGVYNSLEAVPDENVEVFTATREPLLSPWGWT